MFVMSNVRVALIAVLAATVGCVDMVGADLGKFVERTEKQFTVSGKPDVELSTFDGSIEVRPWNKNEVLVVVEKRGRDKADVDAIDIRSEQNGARVTVEVKQPPSERGFHLNWNSSRSAKLIVSVPAASNISAKSGDGSVEVHDVTGDMKVHTGDGSIKLDGLNGAIDVQTGDGSVNATGRLTSVRARSGDGSVTIRAAAGSTSTGDWDITTGDGSVVVEVPEGFGAEVDAHTGDGGIRLQDVSLSNVTGRVDNRNSVKGTLGAGGRALRLRTGDGSITLRRF